jgi:molybdopterin/thiamine biosynthesis adenylyltransferase
MTLSDAQIDRWSRQILLPQVGGRGQQRLLAARVGMARTGRDHPLAAPVADLLARAGVDAAPGRLPPQPDLLIDLAGDAPADAAVAAHVPLVRGACRGPAASVLTLVGRPCASCAPGEAEPQDGPAGDPLAGAAVAACAALVAAEALRVLLERPRAGRRQRIDLRHGTFVSESLETSGCARCREARA